MRCGRRGRGRCRSMDRPAGGRDDESVARWYGRACARSGDGGVRRTTRSRRRRSGRVHPAVPRRSSRPGPTAMLQTGEHLLVVGGASAVGTAAIQLGVTAGARVMAVAGGPEKIELSASLGAHTTIDHTANTDVFDAVMDGTDGHGADVVFDVVAAQTLRRSGPRSPLAAGTCRSASTTIPNRGSPASRCAGSRWATSRSSA